MANKDTSHSKLIYLDYAAATPVSSKVMAAMKPYFDDLFYNPSASYLAAQQVKVALNKARADVALCLGVKPLEVIFTAGGTEANNLAIYGVMSQYPNSNIVVSSIDHESILAPAGRYKCKIAPVQQDGTVDIKALGKLIDEHTAMISIMYANNEIGTIQSLSDVAQLVNAERLRRQAKGSNLPIYFHSDACQAGNYLDLHVDRLGVDMMTINGGKIYGPKQSGVLFISRRLKIYPQILGGGQEMGLRSGTENVAGAIGLSVALKSAQATKKKSSYAMKQLQNKFFSEIERLLPWAIVNGSKTHRLPNNVHLTFPNQDNERLLIQLDERGILAASGSACSASKQQPSHVLTALGFDDAYARSSLRFSMGQQSSESNLIQVVKVLKNLTTAK